MNNSLNQKKIILASSSSYRAAQLKQINLKFSSISPNVDEDLTKNSAMSIEEICLDLAKQKAQVIFKQNPEAIIIAGDQIATLGKKILGKPGSLDKASEQLKVLKGKTHSLLSSLCILYKDQEFMHLEKNNLTMRDLDDVEIKNYLEIDQPFQCAGSYKIEACGPALFSKIESKDFTSITGLPLLELIKILKKLGMSVPASKL